MTLLRLVVPVLLSLPWFSLFACSSRASYPITVKDAGADAVIGGDVVKGTDLASTEDTAASSDVLVQLDLASGTESSLDGNATDAPVPDAGTDLGADAPADAPDTAPDAGADLSADVPSDLPDELPVDAPFQTMLAIAPASAQPKAFLIAGQRLESPIPVVLTVKNKGVTPTGALLAALAGAKPSYYRIDSDTCSGLSLAPQGSCTIAVAFVPPGGWAYGDASLVVSDTTTGESATATLDGDYLVGDCLMATPASLDLGPVLPGTVGSEVIVTVKNWCATLDMSSITIATFDSSIRISKDACTKQTVPPKGECLFGLELAPPTGAQQGLLSCTVEIATDLGWFGVAARGKIVGDSDPLAANPSSVSFNTVPVSQSATRTVTITNYGSVATKPLSASFAVTRITQASITATTCTGVLAAGASCQVTVQYQPLDTAGIYGTITVTDGMHAIGVSVQGSASSPIADGSVDASEGVDGPTLADVRGQGCAGTSCARRWRMTVCTSSTTGVCASTSRRRGRTAPRRWTSRRSPSLRASRPWFLPRADTSRATAVCSRRTPGCAAASCPSPRRKPPPRRSRRSQPASRGTSRGPSSCAGPSGSSSSARGAARRCASSRSSRARTSSTRS